MFVIVCSGSLSLVKNMFPLFLIISLVESLLLPRLPYAFVLAGMQKNWVRDVLEEKIRYYGRRMKYYM